MGSRACDFGLDITKYWIMKVENQLGGGQNDETNCLGWNQYVIT